MPYKVIVDYAPGYELLASAYLYLNRATMRGNSLGPAWFKEVNTTVSAELAAELRDDRLEVLHRLAILAWQCPWNEEYFRRISPDIHVQLEASAQMEADAVHCETAEAQIDRVTNGLYLMPTEVEHTVVLIPQYHCAPYVILDYYDEGLVILQYALRNTGRGQAPEEDLLRIAKCLADEHRLRILSLLADGPKTYTDILRHLRLSKSLVHYHLVQLRIAGLIRYHHLNGRTLRYSLRSEQMEGFAYDLLQYVKRD